MLTYAADLGNCCLVYCLAVCAWSFIRMCMIVCLLGVTVAENVKWLYTFVNRTKWGSLEHWGSVERVIHFCYGQAN